MNEYCEPTLLPYNKNTDGKSKLICEHISINKSKVDELCSKADITTHLCFLSATLITLTKYTNNTDIFILTKINSNDTALIFNAENRNESIINHMMNIKRQLDCQMKHNIDTPHFNFIYGDNNTLNDENMTLHVSETSDLYSLELKFDADKYTHHYIKSFLRSIEKVINQFTDDKINQLKVEDIKLRNEQKTPKFKLLRNPLVNELLEKQAKKTPEKIALRTCRESYTFKEVNDEANKIANALIKKGIKKGSAISFMLPRDKILITTFLGIIKAGCVAIPIDMNYPIERIKYIRKNSDSEYIITYESFKNSINPDDLINEENISFPNVSLKPDDPIFILYTSGSTGNPKGVVLTHCGISNDISAHPKNNYDKLLSISSIAFDISEEDILIALTNEKELIFANDDEIKDIIQLSRLIEKTEPDFINITPSRLLSYLQIPEFRKVIKIFKGIGVGGEQFTKTIFESIKKHADIDIFNYYGPLETSLTSTSKKIKNPDIISNGKPFPNVITDVRDIDGKLLPYGVLGELYIGGVGVSKGYYNMDEKTKESFISINNITYYKTGDYAVQLPSNEITIKGRIDNQIKLRGQRVEPDEIENVIMKYSDINKAVVIINDLNNEKHLCGYFTSKKSVDISDLKQYLENILPRYMVPTFLIQLDEIPETPNGKINRKKLPKPKINTDKILPANDIEEKLFKFSEKILNSAEFGVTDNLFNLGFTSLTLMRLNSDIYHEFKITLKHADMMNNPSIRKISKAIKNSTEIDEIKKITSTGSNKFPMSSQQKRLYVLYRKNPALTNYNLAKVTKLEKDIDINKLENAINKVIDNEEILRTSFKVEKGKYLQEIHETRPVKIDSIKLDSNADMDKIFQENITPFNLEKDALIRVKVIKSGQKTYIFRDMHHIISDQISCELLYEKIRDTYNNKAISTSKIKYKDYACWVKKEQVKEADYWKNKDINEIGSRVFPDFKRPPVQTFNGNKITRRLDKEAIEKLANENNTSIYRLLLSLFIVLLHKYTNENNIQIGTVTSGRTHPNLEETLGMFVNTLPFLQSVSGNDTLKETLRKTEEELTDLFSNQNFSIEQIIEDHNISTNNSYNPLFAIAFIQNTDYTPSYELKWDDNKFDLTCTIKNSLSELTVEFDYNSDLYSFEKINGLTNHYLTLINNIAENMDEKIRNLTILSAQQEEMILDMSCSDSDVKPEAILTTLKRQILKNPQKTILSDCTTSLTYNEFDLKTNSLANYLKDNYNVKKHDNIVMIANRSIESVLGLYSILKLNATYVPISSSTPEKRIKHIIDEVDAKIVLTNIDLEINGINIIDLTQNSLYDYNTDEIELSSGGNLCILHTSGTTGVPKGVQITHENMENFLISAKNQFYDENNSIFYHTTNIGFDTSLFEIIFPIINGMHLYVIDENYDFTQIPENIINQKSVINTVPAKMKMFLTLPNFKKVMENVGMVIFAGEVLTESLVEKIREKYNPVIFNAYGPCEATIFASIKKIISNKITIGKPNINTGIYILNNKKQLCPIGIPGELCIGGKQVTKGYLNNDDETNKHFIVNPFDDGMMYCSGDLAYIDCDGEINFIGRKDSQIKINGQRIEVEEINRQIEENEDIIQSVTVANSEKTQLHSYIVSDKVIDTDKLLNKLKVILVPFMVPSSIMQIDSIPLNNSGKIDVKKLPEPETAKHKYASPTNDTERAIVKIWERILDVEHIGINDNFYSLGGDSIKAIRIVSLLQNEGIVCNPRDIFNYKTPYLIAQNVKYEVNESYEAVQGVFDLHPIQKYFFDQINRNNYTQEFILECSMNPDIRLLQKAVNKLTDLHDMLRAKFNFKNGTVIQEIQSLKTEICEINEIEINDDYKTAIGEIITDSVKSIDVFNKLIDVTLLHCNGKCYLIFVIHHLIIDGVSWSILLDDLTGIYNHLASDNTIYHDEACSYESWLEHIRSFVDGEETIPDESTIVCPLSESQLGIYLDEKLNNKNTAYLTWDLIECDLNKSIDEIETAILSVIGKHPILKARIYENEIPVLICDGLPHINITSSDDTANLLNAFDLEKSLSHFYIINSDERKAILFMAHHIINDAASSSIIKNDLIDAMNNELDDNIDLAFIYNSYDSYKSQFKQEYESAHEFYNKHLADAGDIDILLNAHEDSAGFVSLPIRNIKSRVEEFSIKKGITVGNLLNAVFSYVYSHFIGSDKICFNFIEHGRHDDYSQNAAGMFSRTVPLLVNCKNDLIDNYLSYFSDLALTSIANDIYPFRLLAREYNLRNNVMFEYNYDLNDVSDLKYGLFAGDAPADPISDLLCSVSDIDDGYVISLHHSDKVSSNSAISFVKEYKKALIQFMEKNMLCDVDCGGEKAFFDIETPENNSLPNNDNTLNDYADHNTIEKIIIDAFEDAFNQKGIGLNDDFIQLGGDSITAIRISSMLSKKGIKYNARDILNNKTPYIIAGNIKETEKTSNQITGNYSVMKNTYYNTNEPRITRPYSYKNWVEDITRLVGNIDEKEKEHWIKVNDLLNDSHIKGSAKRFDFKVKVNFDANNQLMLSEEEYWALSIARAYKKTYDKEIIFNRESYGRDESIAKLYRTIGWFTSQYPVVLKITGKNDNISLVNDVYNLKTSFQSIKNLGLNYASLIYITHEFKYKHCPVTFNFLSNEFTYENNLFKSLNPDLKKHENNNTDVHGADFNIHRKDDYYYISGDYPQGTFIDTNFQEFIENIKSELEFIGNYIFDDSNITCALSEPQLEIYYNEKNHDMGTAYSTLGTVKCPFDKTINEIEGAIHGLINKHPILKGRIDDNGDIPLIITDSYPLIEISDRDDYSNLVKPFDLKKYLARFFIVDKNDSKSIVYDIHHIINDGTGFNIINNELITRLEGNPDNNIDLGFLYSSHDSFKSKFEPEYETSYKFFAEQFEDMGQIESLQKDDNGCQKILSLPIHGIKSKVKQYARNNNVTVGILFNAIFAYTYSRFIQNNKVYYNFVEHGRHENYIKNSLGMYARTTPILVNCKHESFKNYLNYFSDLALNSMRNNIYPFRLLKNEFNLNNHILFEYNFDLNNVTDVTDDIIIRDNYKDEFAEFFCIINDINDGYVIHIIHTDMFSSYTAVGFLRLYEKILTQIINGKK